MTSYAVRANDIEKSIGATPIIRGISLRVEHGEAVAIVGPSGSGKSTLMAILGLLTTADGGSLELLGQPVPQTARGLRTARRKGLVTWIPQLPLILPGRTVFENAVLPLRLNGNVESPLAIRRVLDLLDATSLGDLACRSASVLSGGELQRLAVVRALGAGVPIVVADEPTASLDSANTMAVIESLVSNRGATTVLVATHDERVASACARRLPLIDGHLDSSAMVGGRA